MCRKSLEVFCGQCLLVSRVFIYPLACSCLYGLVGIYLLLGDRPVRLHLPVPALVAALSLLDAGPGADPTIMDFSLQPFLTFRCPQRLQVLCIPSPGPDTAVSPKDPLRVECVCLMYVHHQVPPDLSLTTGSCIIG